MTLPLPTVSDPEVQQAFDKLRMQFPLGSEALQANAATKLHTATPTTSGPTTTSTADPMTAVIPEMTITADFGGNVCALVFTGSFSHGSANGTGEIQFFDATANTNIGQRRSGSHATVGGNFTVAVVEPYTPAAGSRTINVRWRTGAGTLTATTLRRSFLILELRR